MAFTSISIVAPSSVKEDEIVNVEARIKNLTNYDIEATATIGRMDGTVLRFGATHKWLSPGQTKSWYDSFIMPNKGVAIYVESWTPKPELGGVWRTDSKARVSIDLVKEIPVPEYKGTIIRKELKYDGITEEIPIY